MKLIGAYNRLFPDCGVVSILLHASKNDDKRFTRIAKKAVRMTAAIFLVGEPTRHGQEWKSVAQEFYGLCEEPVLFENARKHPKDTKCICWE